MLTIRKTTAILLGICTLFFAGGLMLAPPATGPAVILGIQTIAMLAGSVLLWPRNSWRIPDDLFAEPSAPKLPAGPVPLRFNLPGSGISHRELEDLLRLGR
jgi:hypothetical protein